MAKLQEAGTRKFNNITVAKIRRGGFRNLFVILVLLSYGELGLEMCRDYSAPVI